MKSVSYSVPVCSQSPAGFVSVLGELDLFAGGSLAQSSGVALVGGSVLDISGSGSGVASGVHQLSGSASSTVRLGSNTLSVNQTAAATFAGVISDGGRAGGSGGGLAVYGAGALTLTGANTYTGATTVTGELDLGPGGSIAQSASVSLGAAGAVLDVSGAGAGGATVGVRNLSGATGSSIRLGGGVLSITETATATFAGVISDGGRSGGSGGGLIVNGPGKLVLTGANTFTGGIVLQSGTLELGGPTAAGVGHALTFAGAATLQLDAAALSPAGAASVFATAVAGFVSGDHLDLASLNYAAGASVALSGNTLVVTSGGSSVGLTLTGLTSSAAFGLADDGQGHVLVSLAAAGASQQAGFAVQTANLLRVAAGDPALGDPSSPLYAQVQAEAQIAAKLDAGQISAQDAQTALLHLADGTTSVAEISYAFFTGKTPTAAGLGYLTHSTANPTDLNDPYYAQFTTENRYINFAANLATGAGAGAASFQADYGSLSLSDATAKAYAAIFGTTPTADKVTAILTAQVSNGLGGAETRAQYFSDITGGSPAAQKAAAIGFLLADSVKEGFGTYQQADLHFLQDLAHGTAVFNIDLLATYTQAPSLVGQPVADPTIGS